MTWIYFFISSSIFRFISCLILKAGKSILIQSSKILNGRTKNSLVSKNESGQVIVEYILLLLVSSAMALVLINLVSVDPDKSGPVFSYWKKLLEVIGSDIST